jgi:hypothetical protein
MEPKLQLAGYRAVLFNAFYYRRFRQKLTLALLGSQFVPDVV